MNLRLRRESCLIDGRSALNLSKVTVDAYQQSNLIEETRSDHRNHHDVKSPYQSLPESILPYKLRKLKMTTAKLAFAYQKDSQRDVVAAHCKVRKILYCGSEELLTSPHA